MCASEAQIESQMKEMAKQLLSFQARLHELETRNFRCDKGEAQSDELAAKLTNFTARFSPSKERCLQQHEMFAERAKLR